MILKQYLGFLPAAENDPEMHHRKRVSNILLCNSASTINDCIHYLENRKNINVVLLISIIF